ncbi:hypothetical protein Trydic_g7604 [Trypoxylus dichotomus]
MATFIQFRRSRRSSTSSGYMQLLSSLANDLDHMLSVLCTTPPPPYNRLTDNELHNRGDFNILAIANFEEKYHEFKLKNGSVFGGAARMKTLMAEHKGCKLFLGNILTKYNNTNIDERVRKAMEILQYLEPSFIMLGKNEFSYGKSILTQFSSTFSKKIPLSNVKFSEQSEISSFNNCPSLIGYVDDSLNDTSVRKEFVVEGMIPYLEHLAFNYKTRQNVVVAVGCASNEVAERSEKPRMDDIALGKAMVFLNGQCLRSECNFGNLVADAFVQYKSNIYIGENWTNTPIALVAGGTINASINVTSQNGTIYPENIDSALIDDQLVTVELTGMDIRRSLNHGFNVIHKHGGAKFLQVSGLRIIYDPFNDSVQKIVSVKVRTKSGVPKYTLLTRPQKHYVVMTKSLANGEFGHTYFKDHGKLISEEKMTVKEAVFNYIKELRYIYISNSDRITIQAKLTSANLKNCVQNENLQFLEFTCGRTFR